MLQVILEKCMYFKSSRLNNDCSGMHWVSDILSWSLASQGPTNLAEVVKSTKLDLGLQVGRKNYRYRFETVSGKFRYRLLTIWYSIWFGKNTVLVTRSNSIMAVFVEAAALQDAIDIYLFWEFIVSIMYPTSTFTQCNRSKMIYRTVIAWNPGSRSILDKIADAPLLKRGSGVIFTSSEDE